MQEHGEFYRRQCALLQSAFGEFGPGCCLLTTGVLSFRDDLNALAVDEEAAQLPEEPRAFHLHHHDHRPVRARASQ